MTPSEKTSIRRSNLMDASSYKDRYKILETVGEGTYGVVYKAIDNESGRIVALKKIRTSNPEDGIPATSIREIKLLGSLIHPHIIQLHGVIHEPVNSKRANPALLLEFDFLECDLRMFTKRFPRRRLPLSVVKLLIYQILSALHYCHERQIIHRDIKPSNVLIHFTSNHPGPLVIPESLATRNFIAEPTAKHMMDMIDRDIARNGKVEEESTTRTLMSTLCAKLADFGLARMFPLPSRPLTHEVVTLWYRAPEIVLGWDNYTRSIDIWSVGCILLELLYGRPVFSGDSEMETLYKIFQLLGTPSELDWPGLCNLPSFKPQWPVWKRRPDRYNYLRSDLDDLVKDLLDRMLQFAPERRCSAKEAMSHPWFEGIDWSHNNHLGSNRRHFF